MSGGAVARIALIGVMLMTACADAETRAPAQADLIVVEKAARRLTLYARQRPIASLGISLGGAPVGHKEREGDQRTPEGRYSIDARNPGSSYHRSLRISYPNAADRAHAAELGVDPGGLIMIHGIRNGLGFIGSLHRALDWTDGCIALTDAEMDFVWDATPVGTPIEIRP